MEAFTIRNVLKSYINEATESEEETIWFYKNKILIVQSRWSF